MAKRPASSSNAKGLAKVFRGHYQALDSNVFAKDFDENLHQNLDFFVDLWEEDQYATESKVQAALKLVWPRMELSTNKQIAKSVKSVLSTIHYKKSRVTTGQKSPHLSEFLKRIGFHAPALPLAKSESSAAAKSTNKTLQSTGSIAALYGLGKNAASDCKLSQITISDDLAVSQCTIPDSPPDNCHGYYFDYAACCLVRTTQTDKGQVLTEMSKLRSGPNGFAEAVFEDGEVQPTEFPNLELEGFDKPVLKKPAVQKKPAAKTESVQEDSTVQNEDADDDESSEIEVASSLPMLSNKYMYTNGIELKLGNFTGQSYITYKEPGMAKFTLLVACSQKQAARNGKHHHEIMNSIFGHAKSLPNMPSKDDCKKYLLRILLQ